MKRRILKILPLFLFLLTSFACVEKKTGKEIQSPPKQVKQKVKGKKGVWHTVEPGQTLWRICKTYGVDMEEVIRLNNIENPSRLLLLRQKRDHQQELLLHLKVIQALASQANFSGRFPEGCFILGSVPEMEDFMKE